MRKKLLTVMLAALFTFSIIPVAMTYAIYPINVTIDGREVIFTGQAPVIVDGRTLVPIRGVFEQMGFEVSWDDENLQAVLESEDYIVILTVGSYVFTTNNESHALDIPAQIIGESAMLPIRAVLESVGYYLDWYAEGRTVLISSEPFQIAIPPIGVVTADDNLLVGTWEVYEVICLISRYIIPGNYFFETITFHANGYGKLYFPYIFGSYAWYEPLQWRTDGNNLFLRLGRWYQALDAEGDDIGEERIIWGDQENQMIFSIYGNRLTLIFDTYSFELVIVNQY